MSEMTVEEALVAGRPYEAWMTEPDGTEWHCEYDYEYGAGFEEED